jgi:CBS domain-containing protein
VVSVSTVATPGFVPDELTYACEDDLVNSYDFHGFPVVRQQKLVGYITRAKLKMAIGENILGGYTAPLR